MDYVEDWIYSQLLRDDKWAAADTAGLRSQLFGDTEWSDIEEAEWLENQEARGWEDMGS